jgi:hypothetical protein
VRQPGERQPGIDTCFQRGLKFSVATIRLKPGRFFWRNLCLSFLADQWCAARAERGRAHRTHRRHAAQRRRPGPARRLRAAPLAVACEPGGQMISRPRMCGGLQVLAVP